ncbi:E3 ubiquitin-protein ligase SHPRH-like [Anneissia japonica]|uniref:E3 ubiquitin-protein ligase SHPRH-like n=1 Tax=Anneissia japonica TaxID=1529436 RepID=UPI0014254DE2|nr:E3 ubiquitin-protein ligase SHPRH-like [Anneissia japonica]XP_033107048.1 E3 ubiquitin-protein ligase SHPRH-like [Anneissia japonica]
MPGKRKSTPKWMCDEKRKCLSWNMLASEDRPAPRPSGSNSHVEKDASHFNDPFSVANISQANVQSTQSHQEETLHPHDLSYRQYKALWDAADYSITIHDKSPSRSIFELGTFTLQLSSHLSVCCPLDGSSVELPRTLPSHNIFSLFAVTFNRKREYHIIFDNQSNDENVNCNGPYVCFDARFETECKDAYLDDLEVLCRISKGTHFNVTKGVYCAEKSSLDLTVWITDCALKTPKFGAESNKGFRYQKSVQSVMEWLQGIPIEDIGFVKRQRQDFDQVFSFVRQFHKEEEKQRLPLMEGLQHKNLVPRLREYQKEAIQWMIGKEKLINENTKQNRLHCLWKKLNSQGTPLYYNAVSGIFTQVKFLQPEPFPGGILADEMGLGKTVEVLALILNHKRSHQNPTISDPTQNEPVESCTGNSLNDANKDLSQIGIKNLDAEPDETNKSNSETNLSDSGNMLSDGDSKTGCEINTTVDTCLLTAVPESGVDLIMNGPHFESEPGNPVCGVEPQKSRTLQCACGVRQDVSDEVVQCIRCNIWQHTKCVNFDTNILDKEDYYCPHCWSLTDAVKSSATLIITPTSICHQWVDEINRHINLSAIKMLIYKGVKKNGYIQPKDLASYDIVITTYDTLSTELNYVDLPHTNDKTGRKLRHAKRYMATPSPLPCVEWWRVCLDEAQMIESPTAKSATMALRLKAVNRWCVTGTPIQRNMDDLYGLFLFIGIEPYWVKYWWDQLLCRPFYCGKTRPIQEAVAKVLWRTSKKDVIDQINLPPQTEQCHWLKFSPVEQHFYKKQHNDCSGRFMKAFKHLKQGDLDVKLCDVDRDTVQKLLFPLLRLRQACCHPQAVRGQFVPLQKDFLTMDQLLTSLQEKAKIESEECHRQLVCSLNGLAAVHIIKSEVAEAVEKYREVLRSSEEFKEKLRTDKLQLYHAMVNLRKLLDTTPEGVNPTLRDHQLRDLASEIYDGYMAKALVKVNSAKEGLKPVQDKIHELASKIPVSSTWWLDAIDLFQKLGIDDEITSRVKADLDANATAGVISLVNRFRNLPGLQFLLVRHLDLLEEKRKAVCEAVNKLTCDPNEELLQQCIECHLRPFNGEEQQTCPFCEAHKLFTEYEVQLFAFNSSIEDLSILPSTGPKRPQGTWAMSEIERILRTLLSCCKNVNLDDDDGLVESGTVHVQMLETYRKEFKLVRVVWMTLRERVAAMDELEMATMRLRIRLPWEPVDPSTENYVIEPGQVEQQRFKLLNDYALANNELRRKLSQQLYLSNLATSDYSKQGGENPEPCPVCVNSLGCQWTVLQCGHCFCHECMAVLIKGYSSVGRRKSLRCPTCRTSTYVEDISYVSTQLSAQDLEENGVRVRGGHSTKVEAVIRTLLNIQMKEPGVKSIVFSTWTDVLEVIARGLRDNNIEYRSIQYGGHPRFQAKLMDFKHDEKVTTLLLPVQSGAKGLNIIEATHVLLVEPILNVANELQAIGRVHRIGQTKPTVVHRFLIQNTIEERIQAMLQTTYNSTSVDSTELELGGLSLHDLEDIFSEIHIDQQSNYHKSTASLGRPDDASSSFGGPDKVGSSFGRPDEVGSSSVVKLDDVPSTSTDP